MYGDFSRVSHDPAKHYSSVLYQQGRVRLDAEDNESQAILRHAVRSAGIQRRADRAVLGGAVRAHPARRRREPDRGEPAGDHPTGDLPG